MLVRLRDFAELNRISERTVQLHIKENWDKLASHVDRRGKQGTWLDEFAQDFLLDVIQLPSKDEVLVPTAREAALLIQLSEANKALAEAERRAGLNAEAAGKVALLEASYASQVDRIATLAAEKGEVLREKKLLEGFIADAKAEIAVLSDEKAQAEGKALEASGRAQKAQDELTAALAELADRKAHPWKYLFRKKES